MRALYVRNARQKGIAFELTVEQVRELSQSNCHYCGQPPSNIIKPGARNPYPWVYNGIDRMDNSAGYIPENCVPCCSRCNYMKGPHTSYEEMVLVGRALSLWEVTCAAQRPELLELLRDLEESGRARKAQLPRC